MAVREALPPPGARRTSWCGILSCERKKKKKNRAARRWIYSAESSSLSYISAPPAKEAIAWWKGIMVKVNKQWLGYCVADWKGNDFVVEAERCVCVCVFACTVFIGVYVWECVLSRSPVSCSFRWGFLLAASLPADLSVLVSLQGCEMTHRRAHLGPCNLVQLFPSHCCSQAMFYSFLRLHSFPSLLYIHSPRLIRSRFLSLSHIGRSAYFLYLLQSLKFPVCKASIRIP